MATSGCGEVGLDTMTASGLCLFSAFLQIGLNGIAFQLVVGQGGPVGAQQNDILFTQGDQVAEVPAADGAETGD
jgi:hypothetical protein